MKNTAHSSALAAKVAAYNRVGQVANEIAPALFAAIAPFYGQKVLKADGVLTQKVRDALNPFLPTRGAFPSFDVWLSSGRGYSLTVTVKTCETFNGNAFYAEATIYLAKITGTIAEQWDGAPFSPFRTDYNADTVRELRKAYEVARKAANEAESALFPFGEYDR